MRDGKQVLLAEPRSLCAGVRRAIAIIDLALEQHGAPIYVRKEIVHNHYVVREFQPRGVRFVDSEQEVPEGAVCVFSAHGVSPQVRQNADARSRPDGHRRDGCRRGGTGPSPRRTTEMERRRSAALRLGRPYRDR
ncbi:hypothetical protein [Kitasatospora sp. MAA19]|uniref:hypothetical protein n=1 Tax=Kitasatospora sp. MAA19 TaxID=3035090 RepID=UPI002473CA0B|nr:hypothetical protein [Kitasatospora sp. MAA19]